MSQHVTISPTEAADRLAIRELVEAYPHCADRRDATGQMALFTEDTHFVVYMAGEGSDATDDLRGRESLTPVFDNLNTYEVTMHFNGQSTVALDGGRATGETYCLAHHVYSDDGERKLMIAAIRYQDSFIKTDGTWRFAERRLYVRWTETRTLEGAGGCLSRLPGADRVHPHADRPAVRRSRPCVPAGSHGALRSAR